MTDEPGPTAESLPLARLREAGISDAMLAKAADTARRLCARSGPVEGGTLDPRSGLGYQQLLASLARQASR